MEFVFRSSSYTDSDSSSDEDEDATLKAMRVGLRWTLLKRFSVDLMQFRHNFQAAARAKALRSKFEQWEQTQDAKDQESHIRP